MLRMVHSGWEDRTFFDAVPHTCYPPDSPRWRGGHEPDARYFRTFLTVVDGDAPVGRCAIYVNPGLRGTPLLIGSYECVDDPPVAALLFTEAEVLARAEGITKIIGPMDGSTWNTHRFSDTDDRPRFLSEPFHHAYYPSQWRAHGFQPVARYVSHIDHDLRPDTASIAAKDRELMQAGIRIRALDMANVRQEFTRIGAFCMAAFRENLFFTLIPVDEFVAKYMRIVPVIVPELVLLAEDDNGGLLGFILALPDLHEPDPAHRALIVKTAATTKDAPVKGIGHHLLRRMEQVASGMGFRTAIHAFMATHNRSAEGSRSVFGGVPHGSYTLYDKLLP